MGIALGAGATDVFVSWLPLYHDMGLIGAWLGSLLHAAPFYVMPPTSFLARPENWLRVIHRYGGTLSASPNFGFELCLNKIDPDELEGLDLSSLRLVANGAEPVSPRTLHRFTQRFAEFGFRASAMAPVYGLAECSVGLAFPPLGRVPLIDRIDRESLTERGVAHPANPDDHTALELVACGQAIAGHEIRIVDDGGRELPDRREGRLQFRGPSATAGYFHNAEATSQLIRDGWHDSGDRAYVADGDIYITGRIKDVIIRGGRNFYPQELEEAVGRIDGVRKGGVVVFGSSDKASGTERLVVLAETRESEHAPRAALQARIRDVATDILGLPPEIVMLVPLRAIPKTSSGKLRRGAARTLYEQGRIANRPASVRWQIARLWLDGAVAQMRRLGRIASDQIYAAWWWTIVGACYTAAFFAAVLLPRLAWRWAAARWVARAGLFCMGVPLSVTGAERIPGGDAVLVFNHSSYVDALAIATIAPGPLTFVAKKELARQVFAGLFLRRLGTAFVERYDIGDSLSDMEAIATQTRQGRLVVFFPEGTLTRRPGLSEFYLGAFRVAAEAGVPVIPGALRGTRAVLRAGQWFPRRAAISLTIGEPIRPAGTDFAAVRDLRDAARAAVLAASGEPDLGGLVKPAPAPGAAPPP
jgi:1-acyl-sn-glycerol-3-phosphate acyltransferase